MVHRVRICTHTAETGLLQSLGFTLTQPVHIVLPIRAGRFVLDVPNMNDRFGNVNNYFRE